MAQLGFSVDLEGNALLNLFGILGYAETSVRLSLLAQFIIYPVDEMGNLQEHVYCSWHLKHGSSGVQRHHRGQQ